MKLIDRVKKPANEQTELSLYLTVRTASILHSIGIDNIEQLSQADELELLKTPNFGKRCLGECLELLQRFVNEGKL